MQPEISVRGGLSVHPRLKALCSNAQMVTTRLARCARSVPVILDYVYSVGGVFLTMCLWYMINTTTARSVQRC